MEIEEVDAHVEAHAETVAKELPDLCEIYKVNRPVLKFVRALVFWKPKWQAAIDKLIASLDDACPQ